MKQQEMTTGLVVAGFGRHFLVEKANGERLICHPRGKKSQAVVGDVVQWLPTADEGTIEKINPRKNLFYRQDDVRTKSFAANLDQIVVFIAAEPEFSETQLSRALIAASAQKIEVLVVVNKCDLEVPFARVWERLRAYSKMGYRVLPLSLSRSFATNLDVGLSGLQQLLHNKVSLILGPSGAGKSTLINTLVPNANIWTQEISQALNSGKHTTTRTSWYWLSNNPDGAKTALIDSPGFQEFGLNHLKAVELAHNMPDFQPHIADCKFYNCTHLHEPQCAVLAQIKAGNVSTERYRIYGQLFEELSRPDY